MGRKNRNKALCEEQIVQDKINTILTGEELQNISEQRKKEDEQYFDLLSEILNHFKEFNQHHGIDVGRNVSWDDLASLSSQLGKEDTKEE